MKWAGLSDKEIQTKQAQFGKNSLPEKEKKTVVSLFFDQFKSPLVYILIFVIIISLVFKEYEDALLVFIVVALDVVMGFSQEYSAQKTLKSLKNIVQSITTVIRNNERESINTQELVPGDFVLLGSGDRVPADSQVLEGSVFVSEAILTGEEEPVEKTPANKKSNIYMGTVILSGRCTAQVLSIGQKTKIGQIGLSLAEIKERPTPLQKKLSIFSKNLAILITAIALIIFMLGVIDQHPAVEMIRLSLILAIAAIPEGLPIAVTVILSIGMKRVLKRQGLVKKLLSIETLGSTSVICTDKTGTLTEGIMRVVKVDTQDKGKLLYGLTVLNTHRTSLEIATWEYLSHELDHDPQSIIDTSHLIYEEIFESEKKFALTAVERDRHSDVFVLGAPEIILKFCKDSKVSKKQIYEQFLSWTKSGLRVVGLIHKNGTDHHRQGFSWLGMIGIEDPIRVGVKEAVAKAMAAGIKIKVVTGDFRHTAQKVAENIGLEVTEDSLIEGEELEKLSLNELKTRINSLILFCRVSPHQKMNIVAALQNNGEVVAMTGDGVNDAPALKKADIGVVVNSATDVAKDSGDLILLNNNFTTIVSACEEGRVIYQNIIKVVGYVLSNSLVEIVLIVGSLLLNIPFPLTVIQILWLHLICDGPLDIALGFEPADPTIMNKKPQDFSQTNLLNWSMLFLIFAISFTAGLISLFFFNHQIHIGHLENARTVVFGIIGSIDLIYIFAYKDLVKPVVKPKDLLNNWFLLFSVLYGFVVLLSGIYFPPFQKILHTTNTSFSNWLIIIGVGLLTTLWVEIVKKIRRSFS